MKKKHILAGFDIVEYVGRNSEEDSLDSDFWAWEEVDDLIRVEPDSSWDLILALLSRAETMEEISYVAAGPVEDWLNHYGDSHINLFKNELLSNSKLQTALTGVNLPDDLRSSAELRALRKLYLK